MGIIVNNVEYITKGTIIDAPHSKIVAVLQPPRVKEEDG